MPDPTPAAHLTAEVTYEGGLRTRARHVRSGLEIVTDAPVDNHGRGEAFSPTDLAATALASCILTVVGIAAASRDLDVAGMRAEVVKVMGGPPRRIAAVRIGLRVPARGYDAAARKVITAAAEACPVGRSLHPELRQELAITWGDDEAA